MFKNCKNCKNALNIGNTCKPKFLYCNILKTMVKCSLNHKKCEFYNK